MNVNNYLIRKNKTFFSKLRVDVLTRQLSPASYFEWPVDVVVGGDVRVLSRLPEALHSRRLNIDDEGPQFVCPHCLEGLKKDIQIYMKTLLFIYWLSLLCLSWTCVWLNIDDADLAAV